MDFEFYQRLAQDAIVGEAPDDATSLRLLHDAQIELLPLLNAPEDRTIYHVRRELAERSTQDVIKETKEWVSRLDTQAPEYERSVLEALWIHQTQNVVEQDLLVV